MTLYPCSHCRTERIVAPVGQLAAFFRAHDLAEFLEVTVQLRAWIGTDGLMSFCPSCFCMTTDLDGDTPHDH